MFEHLGDSELQQRAAAIILQPAQSAALTAAGIELWVRRDDLIDEQLAGNKFYKLFYNLLAAKAQGYRQLLSFGGAYSNHLHALAAAGQRYGFGTIGIIRGERPPVLSPTMQDAEAWGMRLVFVGRDLYRVLQQPDAMPAPVLLSAWKAQLAQEYGAAYWIPEGGSNLYGAKGMQVLGESLQRQLQSDYSAVCIACGTGTSLAGLAAGIDPGKPAIGFSVLKGEGGLGSSVAHTFAQLVGAANDHSGRRKRALAGNWRLISGYHAGGYGKKHPDYLYRFWQDFEQETAIALDPVYTLKLFWGITQLAQQGYWRKGSRLVAVHTGGLQGRRGFKE